MTNNFSTIKNNLESEKIIYVRINPARSILFDLVLVSGTTYSCTFPFEAPSKLTINGVTATKVTTVTNTSEWSFNETTKELVVRLPQPISYYISAGAGNIVVFYYLFYTNGIDRYCNEDPENTSSTMRFYKGRLNNLPEFSITQEDLVDRVFTIGNTSIDINNFDSDFNQYLSANDSFSRKEIKIWRALNNQDNIKKMYVGICSDMIIGKSVNISVDNVLAIVDDTYYPNGTQTLSTYNLTQYPNMDNESKDYPIYKIYSRCSAAICDNSDNTTLTFPFRTGLTQNTIAIVEGYQLINTNFSASRNKTTNRVWKGCFANSTSSLLESTNNYNKVGGTHVIVVADPYKYRIGDFVGVNFGGWVYGYLVQGVSYTGSTITLVTGLTVFAGTIQIYREVIPVVTVYDNGKYYSLAQGVDYNLSVDSNNIYTVTLLDNFENNFNADPNDELITSGLSGKAKLYYRVYNDTDLSHGTVLKELLEDVGISCYAQSFTDANISYDLKMNFSIPFFGQLDHRPLREILEKLLVSTFGYLTVDNDFNVRYKMFETLTSPLAITENEILKDSMTQEIKVSDIVTELHFENDHVEKVKASFYAKVLSTPFGNEYVNKFREGSIYNQGAEYLHGYKNSKTINHICEDMTNSKLRIGEALKQRRYTIQFNTKGINFETIIGDNISVTSDKLLGASTVNFKVLSIRNNIKQTSIRAIDLLGF